MAKPVKRKAVMYLKSEPKFNRCHYGTGDLEKTIGSEENLEAAKPYIEKTNQKSGS